MAHFLESQFLMWWCHLQEGMYRWEVLALCLVAIRNFCRNLIDQNFSGSGPQHPGPCSSCCVLSRRRHGGLLHTRDTRGTGTTLVLSCVICFCVV